jgi:hypothetical protein
MIKFFFFFFFCLCFVHMQQRQNDARRNKENHTTMHPKESSNKTNADKLTSSLVPAVFFFFFVEFFFFCSLAGRNPLCLSCDSKRSERLNVKHQSTNQSRITKQLKKQAVKSNRCCAALLDVEANCLSKSRQKPHTFISSLILKQSNNKFGQRDVIDACRGNRLDVRVRLASSTIFMVIVDI